MGFYRLEYEGGIFSSRPDVGCVGGKIVDKKRRLCGGMYKKDGSLVFEGLPEEYSGGLQHRAVLQQDSYAVDIRCIAVREELIPVFESITGKKYIDTFNARENAAGEKSEAVPADPWQGVSPQDIAAMSIAFGEEVHRRGLRVMWDPKVIRRMEE